MINKYLIAGFVLHIDCDRDDELERKLLPYITDISADTDITVSICHTSGDIDVKKDNLIKLSDIMYFYSEAEYDVAFYYDSNISKTIAKIEFSKDYKNIDIIVYNLKENHGVDDNQLVFNIVGTAINYAALMNSSFVFHSSSLCYEGSGVAFSAKSGTGKSTHTSLWLHNFPGTFILNDDTPIITQGKDGMFYICGTPWAGTTGINQNFTVPLKALVFLERGEHNTMTRLLPQEAIKPFFEGIRTPLTDSMFSKCLDTLNKLLLTVPVYRLSCNMENEAAIVARDAIFG